MAHPRLYDDLASFWPLISGPQDHEPEAQSIRRILWARLAVRPSGPRRTILELGSGAGHTLVYLTDEYDAVAVDLSQPMLALSKRLNPEVKHVVADLRHIRLRRKFDAVLAHDALEYMLTEHDLAAAIATAGAHLTPGGVFIAGTHYLTETFVPNELSHEYHEADGVEVTHISYVHDPDPADTTFEWVILLLIKEKGRLRIEEDRHCCGLFPRDTWLRLMEQGGFDVQQQELGDWQSDEERPDDDLPGSAAGHLFVGTRR